MRCEVWKDTESVGQIPDFYAGEECGKACSISQKKHVIEHWMKYECGLCESFVESATKFSN
jgi:hypothetical protein